VDPRPILTVTSRESLTLCRFTAVRREIATMVVVPTSNATSTMTMVGGVPGTSPVGQFDGGVLLHDPTPEREDEVGTGRQGGVGGLALHHQQPRLPEGTRTTDAAMITQTRMPMIGTNSTSRMIHAAVLTTVTPSFALPPESITAVR
jgi:hypothetical protein